METKFKPCIGTEIGKDVYYYTDEMVNVCFIGSPNGNWILVDTGLPYHHAQVLEQARKRFGAGNKPVAIMLTNGHADHIGGLMGLSCVWDVPIYAHLNEHPYITGDTPFPLKRQGFTDSIYHTIDMYQAECMACIKQVYPLPSDHQLPGFPDWQWIHTPGCTPGQIALYRQYDGLLIAGDTCMVGGKLPLQRIIPPPRMVTMDYVAAWESISQLEQLHPRILLPGHGPCISGMQVAGGLIYLTEHFYDVVSSRGTHYDENQ